MNKNLLKQAQQLQALLDKAQQELEAETVEASAGGGVVRVVCTGKQKVLSVTIDPTAVDPDDVEMLQDLVLAAVNESMEMAQALADERMSAITGGFKLPGM
jgi:DNA-binding YbaB/EbfC family protein